MARMASRRGTWRPTVSVDHADGLMVLAVAGRLGETGAASTTLRSALTQGLENARGLVVDLSAVDYLSSPGLHLLEEVVVQASARGIPLAFCCFTDPVRIALDLAEMTARLPYVSTRAEAVSVLKRRT